MALRRRSRAARDGDSRVLSAPFELGVSALFIITALHLAQTLLSLPAQHPHVGLMAYPLWLLWAWAAWVFGGGLGMFVGLVLVGPFLRMGRGIEKAGLWLALTGWSTIALADIVEDWRSPLEWGAYVAIVLGCVLRVVALHKIERAVAVVNARNLSDNEGEDVDR